MAVSYGRVTFRAGQEDIPNDALPTTPPSVIPLGGSVMFTPVTNPIIDAATDTLIFLDSRVVLLDYTGTMRDLAVEAGVRLAAGQWRAHFSLNSDWSPPDLDFTVVAGNVVDLTDPTVSVVDVAVTAPLGTAPLGTAPLGGA